MGGVDECAGVGGATYCAVDEGNVCVGGEREGPRQVRRQALHAGVRAARWLGAIGLHGGQQSQMVCRVVAVLATPLLPTTPRTTNATSSENVSSTSVSPWLDKLSPLHKRTEQSSRVSSIPLPLLQISRSISVIRMLSRLVEWWLRRRRLVQSKMGARY